MRFLLSFIELITSPFTYLLKKASGKNHLFPLAKVIIVFVISLIIVTSLILLVYREQIFG